MSRRRPRAHGEELRDEVIRLGPWHIDIEITPEVSTASVPRRPARDLSRDASGRSPSTTRTTASCAGCSGSSRTASRAAACWTAPATAAPTSSTRKEARRGQCLGFDVREHWIDQARFLAEHRGAPDRRHALRGAATSTTCPRSRPGRFDVTLFLGIFYHLPDPVTGLKLAADLTDELLILNTATKAGFPDGLLVADHESRSALMSGTYGPLLVPDRPAGAGAHPRLAGVSGGALLGLAPRPAAARRPRPHRGDRGAHAGFFADLGRGALGPARGSGAARHPTAPGASGDPRRGSRRSLAAARPSTFPGRRGPDRRGRPWHDLDRRGETGAMCATWPSATALDLRPGSLPAAAGRLEEPGRESPTWRGAASTRSRGPGARAPQLVPG